MIKNYIQFLNELNDSGIVSIKMSNLLKANGINLINGQKAIPPLEDMKVLDPSGKDNFVYNRYAHINLAYQSGYEDGIYFQLHENETVNDNYSIIIHNQWISSFVFRFSYKIDALSE